MIVLLLIATIPSIQGRAADRSAARSGRLGQVLTTFSEIDDLIAVIRESTEAYRSNDADSVDHTIGFGVKVSAEVGDFSYKADSFAELMRDERIPSPLHDARIEAIPQAAGISYIELDFGSGRYTVSGDKVLLVNSVAEYIERFKNERQAWPIPYFRLIVLVAIALYGGAHFAMFFDKLGESKIALLGFIHGLLIVVIGWLLGVEVIMDFPECWIYRGDTSNPILRNLVWVVPCVSASVYISIFLLRRNFRDSGSDVGQSTDS